MLYIDALQDWKPVCVCLSFQQEYYDLDKHLYRLDYNGRPNRPSGSQPGVVIRDMSKKNSTFYNRKTGEIWIKVDVCSFSIHLIPFVMIPLAGSGRPFRDAVFQGFMPTIYSVSVLIIVHTVIGYAEGTQAFVQNKGI